MLHQKMLVRELISDTWVIKPIITSNESHYIRAVKAGSALKAQLNAITTERTESLGKI